MTIITQQRALINYDRITSISVILPNEEDKTTYCIVADEAYVLGTYNSQSDALKVLTSIIGNAIIGNYPCVVLPLPEEVNEAVEVVKKEFSKDNTKD